MWIKDRFNFKALSIFIVIVAIGFAAYAIYLSVLINKYENEQMLFIDAESAIYRARIRNYDNKYWPYKTANKELMVKIKDLKKSDLFHEYFYSLNDESSNMDILEAFSEYRDKHQPSGS